MCRRCRRPRIHFSTSFLQTSTWGQLLRPYPRSRRSRVGLVRRGIGVPYHGYRIWWRRLRLE